jgi:predicted negative regulator of RcsB-dependent stress response
MTTRKEKRRELLREDEFHSIVDKIRRYIRENPRQVLVGSVLFLALLGAFFGWKAHLDNKKDALAQILYKAEKILDTNLDDTEKKPAYASEKEKLEAAIEELDIVIDAQSGVVRQQAMVYKIRCLIDLGRQDEVEPLYTELTQKDYGFKFMALMGLGDMYAARGEYDKALGFYDQMIKAHDGEAMKSLVRYKKAICYKDSGDEAKAREELDSLVNEYGVEETDKPPVIAKAQQLLDELNASLEPAAEKEPS